MKSEAQKKSAREYAKRQFEARKLAGLCIGCGKCPPRIDRATCLTCSQIQCRDQRTMREARKAKGLCYHCGKNPPIETAATCKTCNDKYYKEYNPSRSLELRDKVYAYYGNQCQCCSETNPLFLTIDHINNDGAKHRREIRKLGTGSNFYYWLVSNNFPEGFQLLCFNCNCGKQRNKGICPHKV